MIFDALTLHNFGVYRGEHRVELTPEPGRPVVLFGALNGGGKTTLLDAFQLVLFGKLCRTSNRGRLGYQDYLLRCINRAVEASVGAGLALEFRYRRAGQEDRYKVSRTWRVSGLGLKETVEVERNGAIDANITERWQEFVEELLPSQISDLFFFDGEKIESLADLERSAELLKVGIHSLLGLDLVDQLTRSLVVIERRRRAGLGDGRPSAEVEALEKEVGLLKSRTETLSNQRGTARIDLDQAEKELTELERQFRSMGGELYTQRAVVEARHADSTRRLQAAANQLRELAAGEAPLLLVQELAADTEFAAQAEHDAADARSLLKVLEKRDSAIMRRLSAHKGSATLQRAIASYLAESRAEIGSKATMLSVLGVDPAVFVPLSSARMTDVSKSVRRALDEFDDASTELSASEANRLAIPSEGAIAHLVKALEEARERVADLTARFRILGEEYEALLSDIAKREDTLRGLHEAYVSARLADETTERVIRHSRKARETLEHFRSAVALRNLARLEHLIADAFAKLLRKKTLVRTVRIDPTTFALHIHDGHDDEVAAARLSAGERQLLAVAILWSLARASGRSLPTVIDTPLGRLDGAHRKFLVQNYFPTASHQVILLSTDEEIEGRHYEALLFEDLVDGGGFVPLRHACNIPHRIMALDVATAQARWAAARHPMLELFCRTVHPDIDVSELGFDNRLARSPRPAASRVPVAA